MASPTSSPVSSPKKAPAAPETSASPSATTSSVQPQQQQASANSTPASSNNQGQLHTASLYVGDIHPDVTEALLFDIFNAVGPVASIRVCRDAITRRSLGYAYVNFHNVADAERALDTMNYTTIKNIPCRIMWSQRDPSLRKSGVGNIFVKNLDLSIDNKALYDTFSLFGNILSCKVAIDPESGGSKGYGYVHYETAEAANEAIAKINGMLIAGHEVYVGHFQKRQDRREVDDWTNVYVKNIPTHWSDDDLRKEFAPYGEITSCIVMKDPSTSTSRGFGFVNFEEHEGAAAAVNALNGKAYPTENGAETELYVGRAQKRTERERELRNKFEAMKMERVNRYQGLNLYVKNLDDKLTEDDLREFFSPYGNITSCRIMKNENGNSRGFGFVCFSTPEEATKAVAEMNGKIVQGKPIYVALAQRKEVRRAQLEAHHAQRANGMNVGRGMPMGQPVYGAAPMFYAQPNQLPPQARQGFMYPPQMMPRGMNPRGPVPYGRGGAPAPGQGFQMPGYGMPMQQQRQQRRNRQQPGPNGQPNGPSNRRNFKYTANARNHPPREGAAPTQNGGAAPPAAPAQAAASPSIEPLTSAALANATPEQQKNMIGERLYPLVHSRQAEHAGKITGMLLEMDNSELLHLLESPEALDSKVDEAIQVLEAHKRESE